MAIIKCKMCGGDLNITEGISVAECEYCGSRQTIPSADNEKKMTLFTRAARLLRGCEFDKASGVFEAIVADFPEEAEAYWGLVLCKYGIEYVDDPATGKKVPTCHRSSFDSVLDDPNFEQACEFNDAVARRVYRDEVRQIEELRKRIIEVSGKEEPYDVFISYKETGADGQRTLDSVIAQDIYKELTREGYRVFFSRISLEDKLGVEYEPYIFAALNSSKVMLVVGTDYEHFDAVWVKNEWSRFLKLISSGEKKVLIPCFKDMDAYDMPKEFNKLSAQDMGKIGAMQDLLHGIEKIIPRKAEEKKETVIVRETASGGPNATALLKRGEMALQDGKWEDAKGYYDRVLDMDAECAEAYLGLFLVEEKCADTNAFVQKRLSGLKNCEVETLKACSEDAERINSVIKSSLVPNYLTEYQLRPLFNFDRTYKSSLKGRQKQLEAEKQYLTANKNLSRAEKFAAGETKTRIFEMKNGIISHAQKLVEDAKAADETKPAEIKAAYAKHLDEAEVKANKLKESAQARREREYNAACSLMDTAKTELEFRAVVTKFGLLRDYKDSGDKMAQCRAEADKIEAEQKRIAAEKKAEQKRLAEENCHKQNEEYLMAKRALSLLEKKAALEDKMNSLLWPFSVTKRKELEKAIEIVENEIMAIGPIGAKSKESLKEIIIRYHMSKRSTKIICAGKSNTVDPKSYGAVVGITETGGVGNNTGWGDFVDINAGRKKTLGVKWDGTVVVADSSNGVHNVRDWRNVVAGAVGSYRTVGLKPDGTVVAVGGNRDELDSISGWRDIVAISVSNYQTVGLKSNGTVVAVGDNHYGACEVSAWKGIVAISAGNHYTVGLKSDGTVVAVGRNLEGQCNVSHWHNIVAISAYEYCTIGLKSDGTVVTAGYGEEIQHNVSKWHDIIAISVGEYHAVGLKSDGTVVAIGGNRKGQCNVSHWRDIVSISAGCEHTVGLKSNGTVVDTMFNVS